jgi:hypothetical protein
MVRNEMKAGKYMNNLKKMMSNLIEYIDEKLMDNSFSDTAQSPKSIAVSDVTVNDCENYCEITGQVQYLGYMFTCSLGQVQTKGKEE